MKSSSLFFFFFSVLIIRIIFVKKTKGRIIWIILDHGCGITEERLTNIRLWINLEISRIKLSLINPNFYSSLTHKHSLFPPFFLSQFTSRFSCFFLSQISNLYAIEWAKIELWTGHNNHFHFLILITHLKNNWDRRVWKIALAFESI